MAAAAPELVDDMTYEILLHIPPDDPASLVRASLVCKRWRQLLTDPAFLRRYRAFHRTPPMLGFIHNVDHSSNSSYIPRFVATTSPSPFYPDFPSTEHRVPHLLPPYLDFYCTGAVLCATRGCRHVDCHGGPYLVVFVGTGEDDHSWACVYSSETGEWSSQASIAFDSYVEMLPGLLVQDTLYFRCERGKRILGYDIGRHELSEIDPPPLGHEVGILMESGYGGLGFATVEDCSILLWSRYVGDDGIEEWKKSWVIGLDFLNPVGNPSLSWELAGFAEGVHTIFISSEIGVFTIELKSGQVKKLCEEGYYTVVPYMSFYTSDIAIWRPEEPAED
ncbi:hypothetical protein OsJ_22913 [Oryza sativa Japonica Group]|uniref:F-box domain-containing protein n=1 Tax=Oryza sativa subsp. japonica TaxID=39947 RepID=A3BG37_ORYSJ|nr:hypothetical protein OsJ_22913 [Oryza sativa Japonica Group]